MTKNINLWSNHEIERSGASDTLLPSITPYLITSERPTPAVIVCPGGGYTMRAAHEGEPIARWLNSIGVSAIVLHYRVFPALHPAPLLDAKRAVRMVRANASIWNIDSKRIGIMGFSAGGHLAATVGTHYDDGIPSSSDAIERESSRPDFLVLGYPVITLLSNRNSGVRSNLLGDQPDSALVHSLSLETQVTRDTPPTFLWHTADDAVVPVENVLLFATALGRHGVPYELHVFERGIHGLGLAETHREAKQWTDLCENWLKARHIIRAYPRYSEYSTVADLLSDKGATTALEKYFPGISTDDSFSWMRGFTLKHLSTIPEANVSPTVVESLAKELKTVRPTP